MVRDVNLPNLHNVRLGEDTLDGPASKLAAVVLHLGSDDSTTLSNELSAPVKSTTTALGLAIKLVESTDSHELVIAVDGVLLDGVDLGTHNEVHGVLGVGGQVETAVLVGLGGGGVGVLGGVVEGVAVRHLELGGLGLGDDLVGEVVVDVGGFLGEGSGLVDGVLAAVGGVEGRIRSVLVDGHHVQVGGVTLVQEDLVALAHNDNVPGVNGAGGTHEHRQNSVGGKDGRFVLLGEFLDNGVGGGGDVVGGAVDGRKLALGALDGLLVVGAVVVVQEAVVVEVLAFVGVEVELGEAVEVDFFQQVPVRLNVDARIAVASGLVVVSPAKAATTTATSAAATSAIISVALASSCCSSAS